MIAKCVSYVSKHLSSQTLRWPWRGEKCTHFSFVYNENLAVPACVANQLFFLSKETIHCQILSTDYWLSKYHKATGPRLSLHVRSEEFPNFPVPVLSLWTTSNFMNCRNTTFWFAWIAQALWFFLTPIFCSVQIYTFIKKKTCLVWNLSMTLTTVTLLYCYSSTRQRCQYETAKSDFKRLK